MDDNKEKFGRRDDSPNFNRKKVCRAHSKKVVLNYRDPDSLKRFVTERGKILPRRITGLCAKDQRVLTREVKKARVLAYLPFVKK